MTITLYEGDNRASLRHLIDSGIRVHAICTDPPYGLTSIVKRFGGASADDDTKTSRRIRERSDGFGRIAAGGFMGQIWDGTGIERDPEFWRLIWEILLPGGYVIAFSGSRTGHWQACAMEQAGFVMHPMIGWVTGQGFPKAHNAARAVDKALGAEPTVTGTRDPRSMYDGRERTSEAINTNWREAEGRSADRNLAAQTITAPTTPEAQQWDGWAYGTQALKPALEPIYVGQKPFSEKNGALNLLKHGVGAINIDGSRVASPGEKTVRQRTAGDFGLINDDGWQPSPGENGSTLGRHPANLIHDGSDAVVALFPTTPGQLARSSSSSETRKTQNVYGEMHHGAPGSEMEPRNDAGSAARFFNSFPSHVLCEACQDSGQSVEGEPGAIYLGACTVCGGESARELDADPIRYQGKATKADRDGSKHPTVKPIALMQWLCRMVTPPGGTILDPFAGSGTTGEAARREGFECILMEAEPKFIADIRRRFDIPDPHALPSELAALLGDEPTDDLIDLLG